MNHLPLRERLYKIIFEYDSAAGRRFDTSLFVLILASLIAASAFHSAPATHQQAQQDRARQ